ncbi:glycosyltransferase [Leptospira wolffii]|uniref:glycosyltransferase n=1 Tax=Leptospira wolffii TaxID=409998 RepID=UPI001082387B|nr:glycosyltransferase [Leptospira wolffii]TGK62033.1 glycosyltransferase [Leptospira wolffii]TGK68634.1 glycosyltransferase [Leptospira wolffii]TGK74582.1 glycosyltransferase [Leptospira wolffii]TGL31842.1 glycosyltransferase [Leptospira wolffii]
MKAYIHISEFRDRDGIGNDIKGLLEALNSSGIESKIVCQRDLSDGSIPTIKSENLLREENPDSSSVHLLEYGGSGYPIDDFLNFPGRKFVRYQNITPPKFFKSFVSSEIFRSFELDYKKSVLELHKMKRSVETFLPSSKYSASNLEDLNITNSKVMPIVRKYGWSPRNSFRKNGYTLGYVGRIVPSKKIEDLLVLIYFLKKIQPKYRILIVGNVPGIFEEYFSFLKKMSRELDIGSHIQFRLGATDSEMPRFWEEMDSYVSMSEHEGFGIPLVEALSRDLPVFAYACTAVPETLKEAGYLFRKKDPENLRKLAEWIHLILEAENTDHPLDGNYASEKRRKVCMDYDSMPFGRFLKQIFTYKEAASA